MNPAMMDMREVATRLSVSIRTVERLIASGELRAVRVRRSVRVTPEALDAYISGLPCQSANAQIASKSVSASAVVGASNGRSRPAPGDGRGRTSR
jgi:excisionase family DNA binding protein